jgi:hypothetical protein
MLWPRRILLTLLLAALTIVAVSLAARGLLLLHAASDLIVGFTRGSRAAVEGIV